MRNVHEVVEAADGKPILYFPARHDHWLVQTGDGWAAHVAGAIGVSTDAQASWWGGRGVGTVPHGLIAAYGGDTALAARKFADRFAHDMNVTVLVDFANDSLGDGARGGRCARRRPVGRPARHLRRAWPTSASRERYGDDAPTGVNAELVRLVRAELDAHGRRDVKIVVSGGFTADRIRAFEAARRAGRRLRRRLVADPRLERLHGRRRVVDGRPGGKVGRELQPEPAPEPGQRAARRAGRSKRAGAAVRRHERRVPALAGVVPPLVEVDPLDPPRRAAMAKPAAPPRLPSQAAAGARPPVSVSQTGPRTVRRNLVPPRERVASLLLCSAHSFAPRTCRLYTFSHATMLEPSLTSPASTVHRLHAWRMALK